jgi:hypothetical protein
MADGYFFGKSAPRETVSHAVIADSLFFFAMVVSP